MSDASTRHLIEAYMEEAEAPMFLSGFFQSPPRNFHTTEKVEIDILRDDEDVAIVVTDLSAGARNNESTLYTNKGFTPPIFDEKGAIKAYDLIKRQPGVDPFQDPNYAANAYREAVRIFRRLEKKIRRSIELMASQVLQTGTLTLKDAAGTALYVLDFGAKSTHLANAGAAWGSAPDGDGNSTYFPLVDVDALASVVRRNGKKVPKVLVFGSRAWTDFIAADDVQKQLNARRAALADVRPPRRGEEGASYHGTITIGQYQYELWTYDGFYRDPETGLHVPFIGQDKMLMLSDGRLDLSFGAIPMIAAPDPRAMPFLPPRMSSSDRGLDLTTNAWITPDNKQLMVSAGTRPLTIPTAIDTFACLSTR